MKRFIFSLSIVFLLCSTLYAGDRVQNLRAVVARNQCVVTETPESSCSDGIDNDCDGLVDGADSDCAGGSEYTDDFSGDLSAWTQTAGTWTISSGELDETAYSAQTYLQYNSALGSITQYGKFTIASISAVTTDLQVSAVFRWDLAGTERYKLVYGRYYDQFEFKYAEGETDGTTVDSSATAMGVVATDVIGWAVSGTGSGTTVSVWINPVGDYGSWGAADDTLVNTSGSYADDGLYTGFHVIHPYTYTLTMDDWMAGPQ